MKISSGHLFKTLQRLLCKIQAFYHDSQTLFLPCYLFLSNKLFILPCFPPIYILSRVLKIFCALNATPNLSLLGSFPGVFPDSGQNPLDSLVNLLAPY